MWCSAGNLFEPSPVDNQILDQVHDMVKLVNIDPEILDLPRFICWRVIVFYCRQLIFISPATDPGARALSFSAVLTSPPGTAGDRAGISGALITASAAFSTAMISCSSPVARIFPCSVQMDLDLCYLGS